MRLQDKVAVVTGAASGMGKAIAILYAKEGAKVVVSDLTLEGAGATVAEITAFGGTATAVEADVSKERDVYRLIKAALNSYIPALKANIGSLIQDSLIILKNQRIPYL